MLADFGSPILQRARRLSAKSGCNVMARTSRRPAAKVLVIAAMMLPQAPRRYEPEPFSGVRWVLIREEEILCGSIAPQELAGYKEAIRPHTTANPVGRRWPTLDRSSPVPSRIWSPPIGKRQRHGPFAKALLRADRVQSNIALPSCETRRASTCRWIFYQTEIYYELITHFQLSGRPVS
jgi:hypothetical protein